jgi:Flp pilus assembly protein TadD/TolB-like protein
MKRTLLAAVLALLGAFVFSQERITIAVFPFEDLDNILTKNEPLMFYRRFSNEFSNKNNGRFKIVPRQDVEKLINTESTFQLSDLSSKVKTAEMQKVLNGSQILSGYIGKMGNKITISISLFTFPDLEQLPGGVDLDLSDKDDLFNKIPELVQSIQIAISRGSIDTGTTPVVLPSAQTHLDRDKLFQDRNDWDTAILEYTDAIRLDPNFSNAYNLRGNIYHNKGDYDRAIADYNQFLRLESNNAVVYSNRGNSYHGKGDYDRAITDYNQAIRLNPDFAIAYSNRGNSYYSKGDYDRAIADCTQAIRLNPDFAIAYNNRGTSYNKKEDYDRAIADYTQAIRLNPDFAVAYNNRGNSYYSKGDYDRAIADFTQAIRLNPDYAVAYNNRGNSYNKKGEMDKANVDFAKAKQLGYKP